MKKLHNRTGNSRATSINKQNTSHAAIHAIAMLLMQQHELGGGPPLPPPEFQGCQTTKQAPKHEFELGHCC